MGRYDDAIAFLSAHEDPNRSDMNERKTFTSAEVQVLQEQHPEIPVDYLDYLKEIGWGTFRECQYMVYNELFDPKMIFDAETVASFKKRILLFGDNFSGDPAGFLPDENWKVIEILHEDLEIYDPKQTFAEFIRVQMQMDENGDDLRGH
ncbi:MAG: hypothetical protein ACO1QS_09270 [Verrucomicrobiota bacterium]